MNSNRQNKNQSFFLNKKKSVLKAKKTRLFFHNGFLGYLIMLIFFLTLASCSPAERQSKEKIFLTKGKSAFFNKKFEIVIPYFRYILQSKTVPANIKQISHLYLGLSHYHLGEFATAQSHFAKYKKSERDFFRNLVGLSGSEKINNKIISMYQFLMQKEYEKARGLIKQILSDSDKLSGIQMSAMNHAIFASGDCLAYAKLDKKLREMLKKIRHRLAQKESGNPQLTVHSLECILMKHGRKMIQNKEISAKTKKLFALLSQEALSVNFYAPMVESYRDITVGKLDDAMKKAQKVFANSKTQEAFSLVVRLYLLQQKSLQANSFLTKNLDFFSDSAVDQYNLASYWSIIGDQNKAFDALKKSFEQGFRDLMHIVHDPDMIPIRNNKQFQTLLDQFFPKRDFR